MGDEALIARVQKGIENLNQKYGRVTNDIFFFFIARDSGILAKIGGWVMNGNEENYLT